MSGLSAEEERLWSIVTTNSLDFDAWTALIDETERMSEVCLKLKLTYFGVYNLWFVFQWLKPLDGDWYILNNHCNVLLVIYMTA